MVVTVHYLSNGIPVVIDHEPNTECAAMGIHVNVGARHENKNNNGAAHFLEHMAYKGTKTRNAQQIIEAMEDMGASPNAFTSYESTMYHMSGLGADAPVFAELLGDIVTNSVLPAQEMEIERGAIIREIAGYKDDPESVVYENSTMTAFPGQPLGASILGPVKNIQTFKREVLNNFMKKHYHAGNLLVAVAGNVDTPRVLAALEKSIGSAARKAPSLIKPARYVGGVSHEERPTQQLQLVAEFKAAATKDKDFWDTKMLASVLGGGMSSRLFSEIREKRGLVYGIAAGHQSFSDVGTFMIHAATGEDDVQTLIPVLCDELNKIRVNGVEERELQRVKAAAKVGLARAAGSMDSRMRAIPSNFLSLGKVPTAAERMAEIEKITPDSVKAAANKIFAGTLNFATVGPGRKVEAYDKIQARLKL